MVHLPKLALVCALAAAAAPITWAVGCSRSGVIAQANAENRMGHATAITLDELCDYKGAERLPSKPERDARARDLDYRGCVAALQAQTALFEAHRAEVRAIEAAQKGECLIGAPRNLPACDLLGMAAKTWEAAVALGSAIASVRAASEAAP